MSRTQREVAETARVQAEAQAKVIFPMMPLVAQMRRLFRQAHHARQAQAMIAVIPLVAQIPSRHRRPQESYLRQVPNMHTSLAN